MIARILISPELTARKEAIEIVLSDNSYKKAHPDVLYLEDSSKLGVEQAKKIRGFLSLKPYQAQGRAVVVESSHNLTQDAQNSLLKTLEEPPEEAVIILGTNSEHSLIPTILSRCQLIFLPSQTPQPLHSSTPNKIDQLLSLSIEDRFDFIEKLEDKEHFFKELIESYHQGLYSNNSGTKPQKLDYAKKLLQAEEWYKANGNLRAILEYLMLNLPS